MTIFQLLLTLSSPNLDEFNGETCDTNTLDCFNARPMPQVSDVAGGCGFWSNRVEILYIEVKSGFYLCKLHLLFFMCLQSMGLPKAASLSSLISYVILMSQEHFEVGQSLGACYILVLTNSEFHGLCNYTCIDVQHRGSFRYRAWSRFPGYQDRFKAI